MNEKEIRSKVLAAVDDLRDEVIRFTQQVVQTRSIVNEEHEAVTNLVRNKYQSLGLETHLVEEVKTKVNVVGHLKGIGGEKSIGYYSHHDTMPIEEPSKWKHDPWSGAIEGGKIHGVGSADCKAGIACAVGMVQAFQKAGVRLKGDLTLVSCMGEVTSEGVGMKAVVNAGHFNVSAAVQGDPTPSELGVDSITTNHFGLLVLEVVIHGKPGHALFLGYGVNSILKLPEVLKALSKTEIPHEPYKMYPTHPFVYLDHVTAGGATGFTPVKSSIIVRVHLLPRQTKEDGLKAIQNSLDKLKKEDPELDIEVKELAWRVGDEVGDWEKTQELLGVIQNVAVELRGKKMTPVCMTAPAMAHYVIKAGIPTIVWGPGRGLSSDAHRSNEWVGIEDIIEVTKAYCLIAMDYLGFEVQ